MTDAIFPFADSWYVEAIWFVAWPGGDYMAVLWRDGAGPWQLRYRFRYHGADRRDAWQNDDTKTVYSASAESADEQHRVNMTRALDVVTSMLAAEEHGERSKVVVQGDAARAIHLLSQQPWAHVRVSAPSPERPA